MSDFIAEDVKRTLGKFAARCWAKLGAGDTIFAWNVEGVGHGKVPLVDEDRLGRVTTDELNNRKEIDFDIPSKYGISSA